jgi:hypothetical protein
MKRTGDLVRRYAPKQSRARLDPRFWAGKDIPVRYGPGVPYGRFGGGDRPEAGDRPWAAPVSLADLDAITERAQEDHGQRKALPAKADKPSPKHPDGAEPTEHPRPYRELLDGSDENGRTARDASVPSNRPTPDCRISRPSRLRRLSPLSSTNARG